MAVPRIGMALDWRCSNLMEQNIMLPMTAARWSTIQGKRSLELILILSAAIKNKYYSKNLKIKTHKAILPTHLMYDSIKHQTRRNHQEHGNGRHGDDFKREHVVLEFTFNIMRGHHDYCNKVSYPDSNACCMKASTTPQGLMGGLWFGPHDRHPNRK